MLVLDFVDGGLDGVAVVGDAVGVDREVVTGEIDGGGIVELYGVVGLGCSEGERSRKQQDAKTKGLLHDCFL